jgi:hypothetical protein
VASLLFAVHPIHTEAVTGVVGRAELLRNNPSPDLSLKHAVNLVSTCYLGTVEYSPPCRRVQASLWWLAAVFLGSGFIDSRHVPVSVLGCLDIFQGIFLFWKRNIVNLYFWNELRSWSRSCKILSVFQSSFVSNSFRIRSCPGPELFFSIRTLLKVSDPTGSGSPTLYLTVGWLA